MCPAAQARGALADEVIGSHNDGAVLTYCEKLLDVLDAQRADNCMQF